MRERVSVAVRQREERDTQRKSERERVSVAVREGREKGSDGLHMHTWRTCQCGFWRESVLSH